MNITTVLIIFGVPSLLCGCNQAAGLDNNYCAIAPPCPPGPQGPQGDPGVQGPPGEGVVAGGTRLKPLYDIGEDGSREFVSWYDTQRQEKCKARDINGYRRCIPYENIIKGPGLFEDSSCASFIIETYEDGCGFGVPAAREYAFYLTYGSCDEAEERIVQRTESMIMPSKIYQRNEFSKQCGELMPEPNKVYYRANELSATNFVLITPATSL